jgi:hypothetical protein
MNVHFKNHSHFLYLKNTDFEAEVVNITINLASS